LITFGQLQKAMKDRKRFILVFAISWVIGLSGGYYLGVGSAFVPTENVEYNYYFSQNAQDAEVEMVKKECAEKQESECTAKEDDDHFVVILKNVDVLEVPRRILAKLFKTNG
jgi:hypothetical protein